MEYPLCSVVTALAQILFNLSSFPQWFAVPHNYVMKTNTGLKISAALGFCKHNIFTRQRPGGGRMQSNSPLSSLLQLLDNTL